MLISTSILVSKYILKKYSAWDVDRISLDLEETAVNIKLIEIFMGEMFNFFKKSQL
jgi:hypothetical protein